MPLKKTEIVGRFKEFIEDAKTDELFLVNQVLMFRETRGPGRSVDRCLIAEVMESMYRQGA